MIYLKNNLDILDEYRLFICLFLFFMLLSLFLQCLKLKKKLVCVMHMFYAILL